MNHPTQYRTIKDNLVPLTPKTWRGIKRLAQRRFDGSLGLFNSCWRKYREHLNGAIDNPTCIDDVTGWLEQIATEKVNGSGSQFYIYG